MEIISWSLSAIDKIFATRSKGTNEPKCPEGTFMAGYTMDPWNTWRVICLEALSVEDVEDVYLFVFMILGLTVLGLGLLWMNRKIAKGHGYVFKVDEHLTRCFVKLKAEIEKTREAVKEEPPV